MARKAEEDKNRGVAELYTSLIRCRESIEEADRTLGQNIVQSKAPTNSPLRKARRELIKNLTSNDKTMDSERFTHVSIVSNIF